MKLIYVVLLFLAYLINVLHASLPFELDIYDIQCPIPEEFRINNNTGSQCVYSSTETIGIWAEEPRLKKLTQRPECQGLSSPPQLANILNRLGVKFEQTNTGDKENGLKLIQKAMLYGRGCAVGLQNVHMVTLVHYDPLGNRVCIIDNIGAKKIRLMSVKKFMSIWDGWVVVIYNPNDPFPKKVEKHPIKMWYFLEDN